MPTKPIDRLMFAQGNHCFFCSMPLSRADASVEHLVPSSRAGSNSDDNCVVCCKAINMLLGSMSLKEKIKVVLNQKGQFICPNGAGAHVTAPQLAVPTAAAATPEPLSRTIKPPKPVSTAKPSTQTKSAAPTDRALAAKSATPSKPTPPKSRVLPQPVNQAPPASVAARNNSVPGDSSLHRISPETITLVLDNLKARGNARPRHLSSLRATLKATASFRLTDTQVDILIQHLRTSGKVVVKNEMVAYDL